MCLVAESWVLSSFPYFTASDIVSFFKSAPSQTMPEISSLLNTGTLLPHGFCINWTPGLLWLNVISDALIVLAYYSIPITLAYFVWRRKDLTFSSIFLLFGAFILACGTTHLLDVITLWNPIYWLSAGMKAITAVLSASTAIALILLIPKALKLPSQALLEQEVKEHKQTHKELKASKALLCSTIHDLEIRAYESMYELAQRESDQRSLVNAIPDALFELDLHGQCYAAHSAHYDFLSKPPEELIGKTVQEVLSVAAAEIVLSALHEAHEKGRSLGKQIEFNSLRGVLWFELSVTRKPTLNEKAPRFIVVSHNITKRKLAEIDLRIAAIAFESQEGMLVTDASNIILRVNKAFTIITGYSAKEAVGKNPSFLSSGQHDAAFYVAMWASINSSGKWEGEIWDRRKNGEIYPQHLTITAVTDHHGQVSNYVATLTDTTEIKRNEQARLANEIALRNTLVREVHHRIKNNLQGVTGVLSQFVENHPDIAAPLNQVISQVQSISLIHGLQGNTAQGKVLLSELILSIAAAIEVLWKTPVSVELDADCKAISIIETEAVPHALILNELITNAVKHGKQNIDIKVCVDQETPATSIKIEIINCGQLPPHFELTNTKNFGTGLQLVALLLPRAGTKLSWSQSDDTVTATLALYPPIIQTS